MPGPEMRWPGCSEEGAGQVAWGEMRTDGKSAREKDYQLYQTVILTWSFSIPLNSINR
mgnify:CR=1 FL=1